MKFSRGANWSQFILSCGHEMYWAGALNLAAVARLTHNVENWTKLSNLKVSSAAAALAQSINCTIKRLWGIHQTWEGWGTVSVRRGLNVMETDLTGSDYCSSCTSLIPHTAPELHFRMRSRMSEIESTQWFFFLWKGRRIVLNVWKTQYLCE